MIVAGSDPNFSRLCKAMGRDDLVRDPRFAKLIDRAAAATRSTASWPTGRARSTPPMWRPAAWSTTCRWRRPTSAADIFADPHVDARGDLVTVDDPLVGPVRQQAPFPRFVGEGVTAPSGAPILGAHTRDVLREIGVDDDELARLAAAGVI